MLLLSWQSASEGVYDRSRRLSARDRTLFVIVSDYCGRRLPLHGLAPARGPGARNPVEGARRRARRRRRRGSCAGRASTRARSHGAARTMSHHDERGAKTPGEAQEWVTTVAALTARSASRYLRDPCSPIFGSPRGFMGAREREAV